MNIKKQIAQLKNMTKKELKSEYQKLYDEPCRSNNKQHLVKRCAWRIQSLAEGDMTRRSQRINERAMELARDVDIRIRPPNPTPGTTPPTTTTTTTKIKMKHDARLPMIGTKIKRQYKGDEYTVEVLVNGFEYDGQAYKSLSAIAHTITGSHWNGYLFFGLIK